MVRAGYKHRASLLAYGLLGVVISPDPLFGFDRYTLPKEGLLHIVAVLLALCGLRAAKPPDARELALWGFLACSTVSALCAENGYLALRALAITGSALLVYQAAREARDAADRTRWLLALTVAGASAASMALLEAHALIPSWSTLHRAPSGTFGNRNAMAHAVALSLPCAAFVLFRAERAGLRVFAWFALVLGTWAIALSRSRAAWLGAALALLTALGLTLTLRVRVSKRACAALGLALASGIALVNVPNQLHWASATPYVDSMRSLVHLEGPSIAGRRNQAQTTWQMFKAEPWLGVGPGNFRVHAPRFPARDAGGKLREQTPVRLPNDDWLGVLAERGVLAGLCLIALMTGILHGLGVLRRRNDAAELLCGASALVLVVTMGSFDAVLTQAAPAWLSAALFGALMPSSPRAPAGVVLRTARYAALLTMLLSLSGAVRAGVSLWAGHVYSAAPVAIVRYEAAARLDPGHEVLRRKLAEYYTGRRQCGLAAPHLRALAELVPYDPSTQRLLARCSPERGH